MLLGLGARHVCGPWRALRAPARAIHWPACPNPSPYQIFGLDASVAVIDKKRLRKVYYDLVKVYHPDRGTTGDAERFKRIVEAHEILRDDSRRRSYDVSSRDYSASRGGGGGGSGGGVRYERTYRRPFEDDPDFTMWSNASRQKFDEGLYENRIWVLKCVIVVTAIIAGANLLLLKQAAETRAEMLDAQTEKAAAQLARVESSRYPDDTPQDVIDRFLETRQRTLDRYGQQISYRAICEGPSADASRRPANAPRARRPPKRSAEAASSDSDADAGPPRSDRARRANGEHEGPVAAYFGR